MQHSADQVVRRVRHELKLRELTVARIERLGEGFAAITFTGEALADFTSLSFDDHVKFMFPDADADGGQVRRDYTPRRFSREALELVIEFALHGDGQASDRARNAVVGLQALVAGPRIRVGRRRSVSDGAGAPGAERERRTARGDAGVGVLEARCRRAPRESGVIDGACGWWARGAHHASQCPPTSARHEQPGQRRPHQRQRPGSGTVNSSIAHAVGLLL